MDEKTYEDEINAWRTSLDQTLRQENSWLALAGLYWLQEGENTIGSDPGRAIVLPEGIAPAEAGSFRFEDQVAQLFVADDVSVLVDGAPVEQATLQPDTSGAPSFVQLGPLTMTVIKRGQRYGVRLWDNSRTLRETFPGRAWFPIRPEFLVRAAFQPYEVPVMLDLPSADGQQLELPAVGQVVFTLEGQDYQLDALEGPYDGLFLIFRDPTNGEQTYPAGRYLTTARPEGGEVILDFNRAYNPPCAFTEFATCALPPDQNRISVPIEAGEKYEGADV